MRVREEIYGERDLCFSGWHRYQLHNNLDYIDLDCIEYCHRCNTPVALIELAQDVGQQDKPVTVTRKLAEIADVPSYLVFYKGAGEKRQAQVSSIRIRMIHPHKSDEIELNAKQYELFLVRLRYNHQPCYAGRVPIGWWGLSYTDRDVEKVNRILPE